jgi:sugar/nucleoside kinase (ribokinase family)
VSRLVKSLPGLNFLFMNEAEVRTLTGRYSAEAAEWPVLLQAIGLSGGVITRGSKPAIAFQDGRTVTVAPPQLDALADVTGAGDSLAAGFLSAFIEGKPLDLCLRSGVAAAGITVRSPLAVSEKMSRVMLEDAIRLVPPAEILS